ncbi:MAG: carboxypeptidase-like regulatory domain-containing protein [Bacteroidales bacterium]|jgi:iron complex outermembrane receptor protein|nr:carboxypeptidase-like regulatory domain-containing protein [Bacteroidales bacterium]
MMKIFKIKFLMLALMLVSFAAFSQTNVKGVLVDAQSGEVLIGASIVVDGTTIGTATALDGSFNITVPSGSQKMLFSYVGYIEILQDIAVSGDEIDLGKIMLESDAVNINEVKVVASIAIARETPVAISTISPQHIAEKLGTKEYPEILKSTPGVYATKQGGAFGDSRINIRGFDQRNTATMINGVPVNDMENGWVYWSNWAGLADVTRSLQVQRGLGASKVAVPSLGGTINILTKTTDAKQGGNVFTYVGQDGYNKYGFTLSTGLSDNGWAATISLAKSEGDGYVDGTQFESSSYFANISKRLNDEHTLAFSIFGAPQWHGQRDRGSKQSIETWQEKGIKWNPDWGYKNGEVFYAEKNKYHKPQAILNHFWSMDENTSLITAVYASVGTGYGTGGYGDDGKFYTYMREDQIDFDRIVDENIAAGSAGSETLLRSSNNNHQWYGLLTSYNKDLGNMDIMIGIDGRYYIGEHYRQVEDLLGGEFFLEDGVDVNNYNKIVHVGDKIAYANDGYVAWLGLFAQAEYSLDKLNAFVSLSLSDKSYKRIDYFNYFTDDLIKDIEASPALEQQYRDDLGNRYFLEAMKGQETDWANFLGYMVKGGANYNLTDKHNVFFNGGYFQRQPDFDAVYLNYINDLNENAENEKVISFELGYGFRSGIISANLNAYYTKWMDKTFSPSYAVTDATTGAREYFTANILGIDAGHMGVELDFIAKPTTKLTLSGFASIGDWQWLSDVEDVGIYDDNQVLLDTKSLYLKDVHVGDAAQTSFGLGLDYELLKGLKFGADYNFYDNIYAAFDVEDRDTELAENPDSWKLPYYSVVDLNLRYNFKVSDLNATLFCNVDNLFDTEYISEAEGGFNVSDPMESWKKTRVFYGWGRSWSVGLKIRF